MNPNETETDYSLHGDVKNADRADIKRINECATVMELAARVNQFTCNERKSAIATLFLRGFDKENAQARKEQAQDLMAMAKALIDGL